jgi:hypothetical protein
MNKQIFEEQDLPMEQLESIGLAKWGKLMLDEDDLQAMLQGRRTDMLRLENLRFEGLHIAQLDTKLSLRHDENGNVELLLHPIYREVEAPNYLTKEEAEKLERGEVVNIEKFITDEEGKSKQVLVEFDKDTNEFVITDTEQIIAPDTVNGMKLTAEQKKKYRKGQEVEMPDGTAFQYTAVKKEGMRSNKLHLIASLIMDGGVSYLLYKMLHGLLGKKRDEKEAAQLSPQYREAFRDFQKWQKERQTQTEQQPATELQNDEEQFLSR